MVHRFVPCICAIQKWPRHWSVCSEERVPGAPTKSEGHERLKACSSRVRCIQSCAYIAGTPRCSVSVGSLSGIDMSYR